MAKYIVVVGGVISGTGKGVTASSVGLLLKLRGHDVTYIKFDPYLNLNCGIMRPGEHGESFVTDDGIEVDLDLGHAERITNINVGKNNICTSGTLYQELIEGQEVGKYLGDCLQLVPHMTNLVQERLVRLGKLHDIVVAEIGGTVGDSESFAFYEAIRQFKQQHRDDVLIAMVAPILWVQTIKEFKTKPLQNSVKELQRHGLQPDVLFCRVDRPIPTKILDKVAMLTNMKREHVIDAPDVSTIYQVPLEYYDRHVDDLFVDLLRLHRSSCRIHKYREVAEKLVKNDFPTIQIGVFGKYDNCDEAYLSLKEAIIHSGVANNVNVLIRWVKAEELEKKDVGIKVFNDLHGIIIPGGFDGRGVEGKIKAINYARENKIPFLGICLGLQCAVIEFARNVLGLKTANSLEFNKSTEYPVIHFVEGQAGLQKKSGTMRLGSYDCELMPNSLAMEVYGSRIIHERHRHRYEVNPDWLNAYKEHGLLVSGINPKSGLIEIMELDRSKHPYFIATQAHPEFKSRLLSAAPLFRGLVSSAINYKEKLPS